MPYVDFNTMKGLKPSAFKLYVYFLHRTEKTDDNTLTMTLSDLGCELQSKPQWPHPGKQHGNDGQLRSALAQLIQKGLIEKSGNRGRKPNTYRIVNPMPP